MTSCSTDEIPEGFIPETAYELANNYRDSLVIGNFDFCYEKLSEGLKNEVAKDFNLHIHKFFKDKHLIAKRVISSKTEYLYSDNHSKFYNLSYEYQYSDSLWEYFYFKILEKENNLAIVKQICSLHNIDIHYEKNDLHCFTLKISTSKFL